MSTLEDFVLYSQLLPRITIANRERLPGVYETSVSYGDNLHQQVVLMLPINPLDEGQLVVFIHGGEWRRGHPLEYRFVGNFFASQRYPVLLLGYRLVPEFRYPTQVADVFDGLKAGLVAAKENGIQANKLILAGHSAGGHLASLLAFDKTRLSKYGLRQSRIQGLVALSSPLDFSACQNLRVRTLISDFMDGSDWDEANPILFVKGRERIPVLAIHGAMDTLVEVENSVNFAQRINEEDKELAELVISERKLHLDTLDAFLGNGALPALILDWFERL